MGKTVRSAKGVMVDFDLMAIKEQMASAPAPLDVRKRQDFIDRRMRRRLKKKPALRPEVIAPVESAATIVDNSEQGEIVEREVSKKTTSRQKARPKKT